MSAAEYIESSAYLQVSDRCDRCGAQAFGLARVIGVVLKFCGHHYAKHRDALLKVADVMADERYRINLKPTPDEESEGAKA